MPVAYAPAAAPPPPPPIGLWASRAGQRFWSVLSVHQDTAETPWQAGALAVVLRAVLLSLLVTLWVDSALRTLQRSLLGMFGGLLGDFGGLLGNKSMQTFAVVFFGLLLGSALAFGLLYWRGRSRFGDLAAGLADAQWPLLIALLLAWLFSSISTPLALLILVAGIVWGQAVLAAGLQHGGLAFRERVLLQIGIGIVSLGGLVLMVRLAAR